MSCVLFLQSVPWAGARWSQSVAAVTLGIMAVCVAAVFAQKFLMFRSAIRNSREYAPRVAQALKNDRLDEAIRISEKFAVRSHLAALVLAALKVWTEDKESNLPWTFIVKSMTHASQLAAILVNHRHKAFLSLLDAIGRTAPFIGALGGSAVTLALGILLAIPTTWAASYLRDKIERFEIEAKNTAEEFILYAEKSNLSSAA